MVARGPEALLQALQGANGVLLSGPVGPDGDSLGACLALQRWLARLGVDADIAGDVPRRYRFLPGSDALIKDGRVKPGYEAVVILDGDRHRLAPKVAEAFASARVQAIVDHHASTKPDGYTHYWVDPVGVSTCEMVYEALEAAGEPLDVELATMLYVGALFDTGGFRYSNTKPATHRMAAALLETGIDHAEIALKVLMERRLPALHLLGEVTRAANAHCDGKLIVGRVPVKMARRFGMRPGDLEGVVDALVHVQGVEVGVLLIERRAERVKVSLRSGGDVDVAALAHRLTPTGGGHRKAAGAVVALTLDAIEARLTVEVEALLGEVSGNL
ncbi:MAG: bifunctional oligoribonuclease/PAP phosphatase NrnA [Proteobacteria bacterium]|nr:bifunctional oligoribonuclease/PAP phosphatase NrnA [Pseudomonadota bacterium]